MEIAISGQNVPGFTNPYFSKNLVLLPGQGAGETRQISTLGKISETTTKTNAYYVSDRETVKVYTAKGGTEKIYDPPGHFVDTYV